MNKKLLVLIPVLLGLFLSSCGESGGGGSTPSTPSDPVTPTVDYKETVSRARRNTFESAAYEYDFSVKAKIKFAGAVSYSPANYSGTTTVKTDNPETQFLQKRVLSGALVFDSTNYIYNVGTDLIKISADENKDFSVVNHETVSSIYDFDKFNFGHILKTLSDEDVLNAKKSGDKYVLSLHTNFAQDSLLGILNYIDSSIILTALNAYTKSQWGVGLSINAWTTLYSNNYLASFHFDAYVSIKDKFEIGFELDQNFTKYGDYVSISLPSFAGTVTSESEVNEKINEVRSALNNSKNRSTSYYDYNVKTAVDHGISLSNPLGLAVNSTTKGYTKRQIVDNTVYFNNRLEVDSDYKNKDQLGDLVADYDSYRARLTTGEVYNVLDPKVGFNKYTLMEGYNNDTIDNYYMLPSADLLSFDSIKAVKTSTNNNLTTYQFALTTDAVKDVLNFYNKHIRIDYNEVTVFDIHDILSGFNGKKALVKYTVNEENLISSIEMDFKGFYVHKPTQKQVKFRLEVEIEFDYSKSYTAVSKKEDIDNN